MKSLRGRILGPIGTSLLLVSALAACGTTPGSGGGDEGVAGKTIALGAWAPKSGINSSSYPSVEATDACLKNINEKGGINGYTFELHIEDDQYNPSITASVVRKLVTREKVFAMVGGIGSANTLAVRDYLLEQKVPNIPNGPGGTKYMNELTWPYASNPINDGAFEADYAIKELGAKKLGVLYQNDPVGLPKLEGVRAQAKALGAPSPTVSAFTVDTTDFTPALSKLKDSDVVILLGTPNAFPIAVKGAQSLNFEPKWVASQNAAIVSVLAGLPANQTKNMYFNSWFSLQASPGTEEMTAAMKKHYPKTAISVLSVIGWVPCTLFADTFEKITADDKKPTREAFADTMSSIKDFTNPYISGISYVDEAGGSGPVAPNPDEFITIWDGKSLQKHTEPTPVPVVDQGK